MHDILWEQDDDLDGRLSWEEFRHAYFRAERDVSGFAPRRFFTIVDFLLMDRDFSGHISRDEALRIFFERHGNSARMEEMTRDFFADTAASPHTSSLAAAEALEEEEARRKAPPRFSRAGGPSPGLQDGNASSHTATISFAQFYSRFGTYLPQPMNAHQLAHAYGERVRSNPDLSPPRRRTPTRHLIRQHSSRHLGAPLHASPSACASAPHLPRVPTATASASSSAIGSSLVIRTPSPSRASSPSPGASGTTSALLAARAGAPRTPAGCKMPSTHARELAVAPAGRLDRPPRGRGGSPCHLSGMLGNRLHLAGAKPSRTQRMAEIWLVGWCKRPPPVLADSARHRRGPPGASRGSAGARDGAFPLATTTGSSALAPPRTKWPRPPPPASPLV